MQFLLQVRNVWNFWRCRLLCHIRRKLLQLNLGLLQPLELSAGTGGRSRVCGLGKRSLSTQLKFFNLATGCIKLGLRRNQRLHALLNCQALVGQRLCFLRCRGLLFLLRKTIEAFVKCGQLPDRRHVGGRGHPAKQVHLGTGSLHGFGFLRFQLPRLLLLADTRQCLQVLLHRGVVLFGLLQFRQLPSCLALGFFACQIGWVDLGLGDAAQLVNPLLQVGVTLSDVGQVLGRLHVLFTLKTLLFCLLCSRSLRLGFFHATAAFHHIPGGRAIDKAASTPDGGQQTDGIGGLAVFFEGVCVSERQTCLRPLQHLLGNFRGDFSRATNQRTLGNNRLEAFFGQFLSAFFRAPSQQLFNLGTKDLTHHGTAQRDEGSRDIQSCLRSGSKGGFSCTDVNWLPCTLLFCGLALNVAAKHLQSAGSKSAKTAAN